MTLTPHEAETLLALADFMQDGAKSLPTTSTIGRELAASATRLVATVERRQQQSRPRRPRLQLVARDLESELIGPDTPTCQIGLSYRSQLRLSRAGLKALADLDGVTDEQLLAIAGIGPTSVEIIRAALAGLDWLDQEGGE